jgi:hypothetical protein
MRGHRLAVVPLALALGVGAGAGAPVALADPAPPKAHVAGGAPAELTYPSILQVRVDRTERAIERATKQIEKGKLDDATLNLKVVRRQLAAAWRGARYLVRTAPPPVAQDSRARARAAGDAPAAAYASPPESAMRALTLQHEVVSAVIQLIDGSHGAGLAPLSTTLNFALDRRDAALREIVTLSPPAPVAQDSRARARAAGAPVAATFDTLMPTLPPQFDDETQAIDALQQDATDLTAGGRRLLRDAGTQIAATKGFVERTWPPLPADD